MKLIIVESPTKAKTLKKFLGTGYEIAASMGHIRDLPRKKLSVDIEAGFKPDYEVLEHKTKILKQLKSLVKKAGQVILATDLDREGEAIAYHLRYLLKPQPKANGPLAQADKKPKFSRIVFHEITKSAIEAALKQPIKINQNLFKAQQARRILDRIVGYQISPLLWRKVRRGLSAGRVQSPALRLIVEREEEITAFKPDEYWQLKVSLTKLGAKEAFWVELVKKQGKRLEIKSKTEAGAVTADLKLADYSVAALKSKEIKVKNPTPFITSTLQQAASQLFRWSGKKTMRAAQQLYERGLITYHRTDSMALAQEAITKVRQYIEAVYGQEFLPANPNFYKRQSKMVQAAHEAIRPTKMKPEAAAKLKADAQKLYSLIFKRFVACQMNPGIDKSLKLEVSARKGQSAYILETSQRELFFPGWRQAYGKLKEVNSVDLPELEIGQELVFKNLESEQKFTQPPARYSEAMLIKELEKLGIGRPSTYASIVSTIQSRKYVEKLEGRFKPTPLGDGVNQFLEKNFKDIVDYDFTAQMEDELDEIARGKLDWQKMMTEFYQPFAKQLKLTESADRVKIKPESTGKKCPQCKKGEVVIRIGRFGRFLSCSRFPDCDYRASYTQTIKGVNCPDCGAKIVIKQTRKGKRFYGCASYPKCKWASWRKPKPDKSSK